MYTINVSVTEVDDKILMKGLAPALIWAIAFPIILSIPDDVLGGFLIIIYFLLIVPIFIIVYKKTAPLRNQVYKSTTLVFDVIDGSVFIGENKVGITMNQDAQFIISMKNFMNYAIEKRDTKEFLEFLEVNEIPYIRLAPESSEE